MNTRILFIIMVFATGLFFTSCENEDEIAKPVIISLEVGIGDSHVGYIGSDLHIEAEIEAEGKVDSITVEIHKEDGSGDEINVTYDDYAGLKSPTFHKHVDIPSGTEAGDYHLHFIVTDQEGYQTTVEEEITIEELADDEAPVITISSAPEANKSFSTGETISISGNVTDNISLAGMLVALVREDDNISDADVTGSNTSVIVMLHTHDFEDPDAHDFTASIEVGAANDNNMDPKAIEGDNAWQSGNYYILVKSKDAKSNTQISDHYPIQINL